MKLNNESLKSFEQAKTFSEHASKVNISRVDPESRLVFVYPRRKIGLVQNIFLGEFIIIFI